MYVLVYQCGLANVFRVEMDKPRVRVLQHAYSPCEWYCEGLLQAGCQVAVMHCDEPGDIAQRVWAEGPGDLWADAKRPLVRKRT